MADPTQERVSSPPYLPWATFRAFIENLKKTSVPGRIDSTVLTGSGSSKSQQKTAYRFLGLVNDREQAGDALRALVAAFETDAWAGTLAKMLTDRYRSLLADVDIENASHGQLQEVFRAAGCTGSVVDKAIRFWLNGAREAGIKVSDHFPGNGKAGAKAGSRRTGGAGAGRNRRTRKGREEGSAPPKGTQEFPFPMPGKPGARLHLPADITEDEWNLIDTYIRSFIKLRADEG